MEQMSVRQSKQKILVVDDHELILKATLEVLEQQYPEAIILTAQTLQSALAQVEEAHPNLVIMDLSIPATLEAVAQPETGIQLLRTLMGRFPILNIVIQSAHPRSLRRLQPSISAHEGGFTIVDKSLPPSELLTKVDWALQGLIYTPREMRSGLEVKPEWLDVLRLAFQEGLQDKAICKKMNVSERTVRYYWTKIQDALSVYPEDGRNIRIQTELRAREEGLID
jgi:DNA-binding NarL/FixJ family response regulator